MDTGFQSEIRGLQGMKAFSVQSCGTSDTVSPKCLLDAAQGALPARLGVSSGLRLPVLRVLLIGLSGDGN